jgi:hypothetical protein
MLVKNSYPPFNYLQVDDRKVTDYEYTVESLDHWLWRKSFILTNNLNGGLSRDELKRIYDIFIDVCVYFCWARCVGSNSLEMFGHLAEEGMFNEYVEFLCNTHKMLTFGIDMFNIARWVENKYDARDIMFGIERMISAAESSKLSYRTELQKEIESAEGVDLQFVLVILTLQLIYEEDPMFIIRNIEENIICNDFTTESYQRKNSGYDFDLKNDLKFALNIVPFNNINEMFRSLNLIGILN